MDLDLTYTIKGNEKMFNIISEKSLGYEILDNFKGYWRKSKSSRNEHIVTTDLDLIKKIIDFIKNKVKTERYQEESQFKEMIDNVNDIDYLLIYVA